ncbi:MAG: FtsW/RodA/SpoVE family cell cycle protein [Candidatus Limnocylindrales bacterium]|jgi:rod shape determining protein RodA
MSILRDQPFKLRGWEPKGGSLSWRNYDFQLTTYAILLTLFGFAMAYSNSVGANNTPLTINSPFVRTIMWAVIAAVVLGLTTALDYRWLRSFAWPLYFINIALLIVTLRIGSGTGQAGTAARWVVIAGFQFQFSELAKILMVVVFAAFLADRQPKIKSPWTIIGVLIILIPPWILVMLQPDLGTSLVLVATVTGLLFMSGASLFWLGTLAAAVVAAIPFVWSHMADYQQARLLTLLNPGADPQGGGYQIIQAEAAVIAGGFGGKGLTNGSVAVPVATTDFVWGVLVEELGFAGAMVVLVLFALLIWRLLVSAWRASDQFATLVGCGMATMIFFQVVVNVGMVMGMLPVTGIPLPFISYGGASLVSLAAGLGALQSTNLRREKPEW